MKASLLILWLSLLTIPAFAAEGQVRAILDGDTVDVSAHGVLVRLRFAGIAAPELHSLVPCAEAIGQTAKARMVALLSGQTVRYESLGLDKYQRTRAMVFLGDVWLSELLVREGLARSVASYPVSKADRVRLLTAEAEAKAEYRGMWGR